MSQAENKVNWCLQKAERELKEGQKHRGLIVVKTNKEKAREYITKAEHYLKATDYLKKGNFSDISTSTIFYSMYHCLLAIAAKFGYESRNQECTFVLILSLIEDKKINLEQSLIDKIAKLDSKEDENTSLDIREKYQYGTSLSIKDEHLYKELFSLAQEVIGKAKVIIEEP
ncbi:MAG: hypothetical protein KKB21_00685 [Nanoarchaeota archaeon]|nr:hypothetical protein [Nanoarchaeota archaeon]